MMKMVMKMVMKIVRMVRMGDLCSATVMYLATVEQLVR